jgi:hypothetical protein
LEDVISIRPVLARLLALTIAVVAAGGSSPSRAPQALRVWVDSAGEVSGAPRARVARAPAASRLAPASTCPALPDGHHVDPVDPGLATATAESGTLVWPTASGGRDVVTRKRSLLI